ncbi:rhodanese-like domain-containing protein [Chthonobacter rhizosphaerae]|uniref:rhodanese-like domain-containing protein n=1 Tax=Chthonobacter rhizosphaerae TaxID=2735553 RepID=UPI0015EFD8ED|nr:rhodanese-like domain-containing protein [Chthonobacter rhizosphaerae]
MFGFGRRAPVKTLSPLEAKAAADEGAVQLVDVREAGEWRQARIPGAIHAPLSAFREVAHSLPADRPLVFYCLSGARSAQAVALATALGLPHDTHMAGGISAWQVHGLPIDR